MKKEKPLKKGSKTAQPSRKNKDSNPKIKTKKGY